MSPPDLRDMRKKVTLTVEPGPAAGRDCLSKMLSVLVDNDGCEWVQACHAMVLPLALVQSDLGVALHVSIEQPIDDDQCALDAANFTQGSDRRMLAGISGKLSQ